MNVRLSNSIGDVLVFDLVARDTFRATVRGAEYDESKAAELAEDLATRAIQSLPNALQSGSLPSIIHFKVIGYNGEMHTHAIRLLRALAASDEWLKGCRAIDFRHHDVQLGEYYLLSRCLAQGIEIKQGWTHADLVTRLVLPGGAQHRGPDFQLHELDFPKGNVEARELEPADALFVASMPNYLNPMCPVMADLTFRGAKVTALVARSMLERVPHVSGVRWAAIESLMNSKEASNRISSTNLAMAWKASGLQSPDSMIHEGIDLWPVVTRDVFHVASDVAVDALMVRSIANRALQQSGAKVLAVARLRRMTELAFADAAKGANARIAMILHGHISDSPRLKFDAGSFKACDVICAWGDSQATTVRALAGPRVRVAVTGNPQWDAVASRGLAPDSDRQQVRRSCAIQLNLVEDDLWFVWLSQDLSRGVFPLVQQTVLGVPGTCLIVKVHPSENPETYAALVDPANEARVRVTRAVPELHDLLHAADVALTFHSTTNIEALLLGTPVVTVVPKDLESLDRVIYLEKFGQPVATDEASLVRALREIVRVHSLDERALREQARQAAHAIVAHAPTLPSAVERVCLELGF